MLCLENALYKFCNLISFIRQKRKIKNVIDISNKCIILTDNNQIIALSIKISARLNKWIIVEPYELSITLSSLWFSTGDHTNSELLYLLYGWVQGTIRTLNYSIFSMVEFRGPYELSITLSSLWLSSGERPTMNGFF